MNENIDDFQKFCSKCNKPLFKGKNFHGFNYEISPQGDGDSYFFVLCKNCHILIMKEIKGAFVPKED